MILVDTAREALAWGDHERMEGSIVRVDPGTPGENGVASHEVSWREDGVVDGAAWCLLVDGDVPAEGDKIVVWGRLFGRIRGIAINGQVRSYLTPAESQDKQRAEAEAMRAAKVKDWQDKLPEVERRVAALPEIFQKRWQGFIARNPNFGPFYGMYELFCCEQAVIIADTLKTSADVESFRALGSWDKQRELVPGLDGGHSGNTFAVASGLAWYYLAQPAAIPDLHGAMCVVSGCVQVGCKVATEAKQ